MRLQSALILSSLLLASGAGYYLSLHGSNVVKDGPVTSALAAELEQPKVRSVNFEKLAPFQFSEMQVFEPFTGRNEICRAVNLTGWDCLQKVPFQVEASHYFVVFRQQTAVVHREYQSVKHGRYLGITNGYRTTDGTSTFTVVRNFSSRDAQGRPQVYLAPQRPGVVPSVSR